MGLIELLIVILVVLWLAGYFGRGRFYARGPALTAGWASGNLVHTLLVIALVLLILRILRVI